MIPTRLCGTQVCYTLWHSIQHSTGACQDMSLLEVCLHTQQCNGKVVMQALSAWSCLRWCRASRWRHTGIPLPILRSHSLQWPSPLHLRYGIGCLRLEACSPRDSLDWQAVIIVLTADPLLMQLRPSCSSVQVFEFNDMKWSLWDRWILEGDLTVQQVLDWFRVSCLRHLDCSRWHFAANVSWSCRCCMWTVCLSRVLASSMSTFLSC